MSSLLSSEPSVPPAEPRDAAADERSQDKERGAHTPAASASHLPTADRRRYKTFISSHGIFEVECRYEIRDVIGQGAYGVVCCAYDMLLHKNIAIKQIQNIFDHRSLAKRTLRELKILRMIKHENILALDRVMRPHSSTFNNIYLCCELRETDLACVIRSPQPLSDEHCQFFIYQVLRGLKFIHSANIIHRDLKPRNILVNSNCDLKICDLGLARVLDGYHRAPMSNYVATRWYRAPEIILNQPKEYGKPVDMWSVGCILAELIGRKPLFPGRDSFHQITLITQLIGTPTHNASSGTISTPPSSPPPPSSSDNTRKNSDFLSGLPFKPKMPFTQHFPKASRLACDLLDKLLVFDPASRLTVEEALAHPYLAEFHCVSDEPVCTTFESREFYFEHMKLSRDELRTLIHQEIVTHYPEETFMPTAGKDAAHELTATFTQAVHLHDKKKGSAKTRRKSI